ncbi:MAG: hypothetical protein HKN46_03835 [Acidimicrobiia bacterium]|nr:hypothetical protein [Acidimicrobiia bacterium]
MDLQAVIAELNELATRLAATDDEVEAARIRRRQEELRTAAAAVDAAARRPELERELAQLERRLETLDESHIRSRASGGFLKGALWGDYEFPRDAEELNSQIDDANDRDRIEERVAVLRQRLGLPKAD